MDELRIDKYLWSIRVYKTRTDATDACKGGKVRVNGSDIKPSKGVKVGDMITARKGAVMYTYKVLELIDKRQGAKLVPRYAENLTPQEELDKLAQGRTTLIVAHRFSTIRNAHRILVFDAGRIVGDGTHDELYAGCPLYKELYDRQGID